MLLRAERLTKRYGGFTAVEDVSFDLDAGETLALIGPSGCGKTTTLKLLNRLIEPDSGAVRLGGREAHEMDAHLWRRRIGYVLQNAGLFPHRSVSENVLITPTLLGWDDDRLSEKLASVLDMVGLPAAEFGDRRPDELSGGQRQRVGLARALAGEPDLLLMDEPFAALDPLTKDSLIEDLIALRGRLGFAAVIVTHDFSEALRFADRIAVMESGALVQVGRPQDLIDAPQSPAVEDLLAAPRRTARAVSAAFSGAAP